MRVIRTEFYHYDWAHDGAVPAMCAAWLRGQPDEIGKMRELPALIQRGTFPAALGVGLTLHKVNEEEFDAALKRTIGMAIAQERFDEIDKMIMGRLVDRFLDEPIVIERSPPEYITSRGLKSLIKGPAAVGALVGVWAGSEHPPLMLVTIPLGMMLVGSAAGVSYALEKALYRLVLDKLRPPKADS